MAVRRITAALGIAGAGTLLFLLAPQILAAARVSLDSHRTLGTPVSYRNLTLIPVYNTKAKATHTYITLDEGLKAKQVTIQESKDGGEVNTLFVSNTSDRPLYLMAGEVVLGGQQDRTLAKDLIVSAHKSNVPITVFCVEHGRWTGRSDFDQSAQSVASGDIRASAQEGEFVAAREAAKPTAAPRGQSASGSYADVPASATVTLGNSSAVGEAQQKVWDKVAHKNARFKTESDTGTYREALNMAGGDAQKSMPAYVKALSNSLGADPHLVGVVAAINGKVVAADIFNDPGLFRKLWPKLLRSYTADAVENAPEQGQKVPAVTAAQAKRFLIAASDARSTQENRTGISATRRLESSESVSYWLLPAKQASAAADPNAAIHASVIRK